MGWKALLPVLLLSSIVGAVVGVVLIVLKRRGRDIPIPFGPYLATAGFIVMPPRVLARHRSPRLMPGLRIGLTGGVGSARHGGRHAGNSVPESSTPTRSSKN